MPRRSTVPQDVPWWVEIVGLDGHLTLVTKTGTCPQQVLSMVTRDNWYWYTPDAQRPDTLMGVQLAGARIRVSPKTRTPPNPPLQ